MARGRFISNDVINDKEINDLSSDTCRLAYVFLITIADREGRVAGDPAYLKSLLFPRRYDVTPDMVQDFILEWIDAGFVIWYECSNGEKALRLVNFEKHQTGLRKEREALSKFDDPEHCTILAGEIETNDEPVKEKINTKNNSNDNIKLNSKSGVGDGVSPDKVGSSFDNNDRSPLIEAFERETKIIQPSEIVDPRGFMSWEKEVAKWETMGAQASDVRDAIRKADEMKSNLSWPGSVTKYMASSIARRKRGVKPGRQDAHHLEPASYKGWKQ
jgi:hypothetical protein